MPNLYDILPEVPIARRQLAFTLAKLPDLG